MNKVKVDNLHTLIQSLSPTEKRFFKRFLKGRKQEQNDYLRLFDELNSMHEYNREVLLKKISIYNFQAHLEV